MKQYNVTGVTFIRNTMEGAFCLFESMATFMPLVNDMIIVDLGSNDGTLEFLNVIARNNPKVRLEHSKFSRQDASAFADMANYCISKATCDNVLFWQADEIWHEKLVERMANEFEQGQ